MTTTIIVLALLGGALWLWQDTLKASETAVRVGKEACRYMQIQFLDETVSLQRWQLARNAEGMLCIRRIYRFDFFTGDGNRYRGHIHMLAHFMEHLELPQVPENASSQHD